MIHGKIVDKSERRIQIHMDQKTHMQHLTDILEVQARGKVTRRHVEACQSKGGWLGPPWWLAEWAQAPPTFPLDRKLPHTFLKAVPGAWTGETQRKTPC